MAKSRNELSDILHRFCANVYYQPPSGYKISYPCIVYELDRPDVIYANNEKYRMYDQYSLKYITRNPDDLTRNEIIKLRLCSAEKPYVAENLYHYPFRIYW